MIDLHAHILPGLDDGSSSLKESLVMAERAVADGITHLVATPHGPGPDPAATIVQRDQALAQLQTALADAAIPLQVLPGLEYYSDGHSIATCAAHPGCFLPSFATFGSSRHLLLELPPNVSMSFVAHQLFKAQLQDISLLLAHPERYFDFSQHHSLLCDLMDQGLYLQFNASSFVGSFWRQSFRRRLLALIRHNPHQAIIASDAHNATTRPPLLSTARKCILSAFDSATWRQLTLHTPAKILSLKVT